MVFITFLLFSYWSVTDMIGIFIIVFIAPGVKLSDYLFTFYVALMPARCSSKRPVSEGALIYSFVSDVSGLTIYAFPTKLILS